MTEQKQTIEIDVFDIKNAVQQFFMEKTVSILESAVDLDSLKEQAKRVLAGDYFKDAKILRIIGDQCEWSLGDAFREALESKKFKDHIASITDDLIADPEFNAELRQCLKENVLKRV